MTRRQKRPFVRIGKPERGTPDRSHLLSMSYDLAGEAETGNADRAGGEYRGAVV
jgi:hypothetical protein